MLSSAQIKEFQTRGFLVLEDVLDEETVAAVRRDHAARMDALYRGWAEAGRVPRARALGFWDQLRLAGKGGCDWAQALDISLPPGRVAADTPFHAGPAVFDMLRQPALLDVIEALIGPEITSNPIQHMRIKPPAGHLPEGETRALLASAAWHQDRAATQPEADGSTTVTAWLALSDATVQNGCLQVIPGVPALYPHVMRNQLTIAEGALDEKRAVSVPVPRGGVVLLHPLTPHRSLPNRTHGYRWSCDLRYTVTGQPTGRAQFPAFPVRSERAPSSVLTDWREARDLWLAARDRLAGKPFAVHRWPAEGPVCV